MKPSVKVGRCHYWGNWSNTVGKPGQSLSPEIRVHEIILSGCETLGAVSICQAIERRKKRALVR
jgi:hypothetical protein